MSALIFCLEDEIRRLNSVIEALTARTVQLEAKLREKDDE